MQPKLIFAVLAVLGPLVAADTCTGENCQIEDETSFVQLKTVVQKGSGNDAAVVETKATLIEEVDVEIDAVPTGCEAPVYCVDTGAICSGNAQDCKDYGLKVVGYTKQCGVKCESGEAVRCAKCGASFKDVARPTAKPVTPWVAPSTARRRALKVVTTTAAPLVLPKFHLGSYHYKFDAGAVGNATAAITKANKNIMGYKKVLCNVTSEIEAIKKNISHFERKERKAHEEALRLRRDAVRYAKKTVLANITVMKATKAMDDAYFAQKGSANEALRMVAHATNQKLRKIYYKKQLIDKLEELKKAEEALRVGKIAVNHAHAEAKEAASLTSQHLHHHRRKREIAKRHEHEEFKYAEHEAVKKEMEDAYAEASPQFEADGKMESRNRSNVPTYGSPAYGVGFDAGPPCHCVLGSPGCTCG